MKISKNSRPLRVFFGECKIKEKSFEDDIAQLGLDLPDELFTDSQNLTTKEAMKLCKSVLEKIAKETERRMREKRSLKQEENWSKKQRPVWSQRKCGSCRSSNFYKKQKGNEKEKEEEKEALRRKYKALT